MEYERFEVYMRSVIDGFQNQMFCADESVDKDWHSRRYNDGIGILMELQSEYYNENDE